MSHDGILQRFRCVLDEVCKRNGYQEALLNNLSPHYDKFQEWKCMGPGAFSECPSGSVCVDDGKDGGTCCLGQPTYDRPGSCPVNDLDACAGRSCDSDGECPGQEKCCDGDCGRRCIKPVHVTSCDNICPDGLVCAATSRPKTDCPENDCEPVHKCVPPPGDAQTCGNAQCRAGFKCESYQPPCPPPSCPPFSESADCVMPNCPPLHMCTDLRPQSCRELQCSDGTRCKMIKDKCAPGKLCRKTKKAECVPVCSRECWGARKCKLVSKCPSDGGECEHQQRCVSARVPPGTCPQCKPGTECALRKRCRKCKPHHVCVLSQGVCPHLPARKLGPESATCKREMERSPYLCVADTDCKKRQKCCTSVCERQICMAAQEP
ncbi:zonadhesin-like [Aplysia californica]|uniref:Zonadhesin-like n=1 Tax=Aplysia californica TaxID=6500 RepID=A0ABM0K1T9_APLCA|nr:zonadhesin-like [Aplysia californica]